MLCEFIAVNRDEIIRRCRMKVGTMPVPPPTEAASDHAIPQFLDQLVRALRLGLPSSQEMVSSAARHGSDLLHQGFPVSQVVHNYGDVCQSITELALETSAPISTDDFRMLNGCVDNAIADAVTQYGCERNQSTIDDGAILENERLGFFTHELRNLIHTAIIAFEVVEVGNMRASSTTGAVLHRSLVGARDLIARSLAEVGLTRGVQKREPFLVSAFIDELAPAAAMAANVRDLKLTVMPVDEAVVIDADRQVLSAVVMNVLQNAFKFTRPRTTVILRVAASAERVLLEIQDECGGLPDGDVNQLFRSFDQRSANRTGLGLGLAFSRWATEANDGQIFARTLPGVGCVFTIDLPRVPMAALATA